VLVHGSGSSADSFHALAPLLARRFRVIAFDLPGHARTRVPEGYTPDLTTIADSVHALLGHLGCAPALLVGHSAGAAVLARLALDQRVRPSLLVGVGAALLPFEGLAGLLLPATARVLAQPGVASLLASSVDAALVDRLIHGVGSRLGAEGRAHYHRLASSQAHLGGVLAMFARWNLDALFAELPQLKPPLLLVGGELDRAVPLAQLRRVAALVPGASLEVIAGAGHLVHEERPREVARSILERLG
jgi:magnesium chelatase accessory protein